MLTKTAWRKPEIVFLDITQTFGGGTWGGDENDQYHPDQEWFMNRYDEYMKDLVNYEIPLNIVPKS